MPAMPRTRAAETAPSYPVFERSMTEGIPAPMLDTARVLMIGVGLQVDWRRLKKVSGSIIEINLNPDITKVIATPASPPRRGRRTATRA